MAFTISSLVWLILLIAFVVVEALTVSLVSIWFAAGAVAALIVSGFTSSWLVQFAVFAVVSAVALAATRPLVKKRMTARRVPTNADINVGRKAQVLVEVTPDVTGRVLERPQRTNHSRGLPVRGAERGRRNADRAPRHRHCGGMTPCILFPS